MTTLGVGYGNTPFDKHGGTQRTPHHGYLLAPRECRSLLKGELALVRLILVRHGQSESNVTASLDSAEPGAPLTVLGRQQAEGLPARLAGEHIDRIATSPLARAVATAQPLVSVLGLPVMTDQGLREVRVGDLEMRNDLAAHQAHLSLVTAWVNGDLDPRDPGAPENGHDFLERYDRAIAAAIEGVQTVLVVSHGDAIRIWVGSRCENIERDQSLKRGLSNTGTVVLEGEPGLWRIVEWHDGYAVSIDDDPTGAPIPN